MTSNDSIEFLCPHCMVTNNHILLEKEQQNIEIKVRCSSCLKPFEIIVTEGINGKNNAVVND